MSSSRSSSSNRLLLVALLSCAVGCAGPGPGVAPKTLAWRQANLVVLPLENLSGESAPLGELRALLERRLRSLGFPVRDDASIDGFLQVHRVRFTGGIDEETATAFRQELQTAAVLITTVELAKPSSPPRVALVSRLVSTGADPSILWMETVGLAGDDHPGLLGLGLVKDPATLWSRAVDGLMASLSEHLTGDGAAVGAAAEGGRRLRPRLAFRSPGLSTERAHRVVVLPFFNRSLRRNAGEIVGLHFVDQLRRRNVTVIEPGVVRQRLLRFRFVMTEGIGASDIDLIANSIGADLIVTGTVREYEDYEGPWGQPKVDFSAQVIDAATKRVVWSSKSYGQGRDGVVLWNWGTWGTAGALAGGMVGAISDRLAGEEQARSESPSRDSVR
ncbi:MAG: hypothetical protein HZB55_12790 [Deltaproteobacteria bacterium]|nr:hypothetical protein [Deltaproteobacteria bacterium]